LDVAPIVLGQLFGNEELSDDPDDAFSDALYLLLQQEWDAVVQGLRAAYGDDNDLFVALWRSVRGFLAPEPGDEDYGQKYDAEILNDAVWSTSFILPGFQRFHRKPERRRPATPPRAAASPPTPATASVRSGGAGRPRRPDSIG
jgi:hypothetical protein